jgi:hypothetical protein
LIAKVTLISEINKYFRENIVLFSFELVYAGQALQASITP